MGFVAAVGADAQAAAIVQPGERDAAAVYEETVLAAATASVDRAGARLRAPVRLHVAGVGDRVRPVDLPAACNSANTWPCWITLNLLDRRRNRGITSTPEGHSSTPSFLGRWSRTG